MKSVLAMVTLSALALVNVAGCSAQPAPEPTSYVAVIDAGSSGTRIHLYSETDRTIREVPLENDERDVPLASFENNPDVAGDEGIAPLLGEIEAFADQSGVAKEDITVNVLGTAGMRKVDAATSASIYADAGVAITDAGFARGLTETISGDQEALFAWTDANDLNGSLGRSNVAPIGIVEVGGASAQIAFALSEPDASAEPHVTEVVIDGVNYPVFTYSYLGLGQNDARAAMLNETAVGVTCYPNSAVAAQTIELNETLTVAASEVQFDFPACAQRYQEVITETAEAFPLSQLMTLPGFDATEFYGLSSIAFAAEDFEVAPDNAQSSFETAVSTACSGPGAAERVSERFGANEQAFAIHACANGTYIAALIEDLDIANENFIAGADFSGESPNWTRGFAVLSAWGQV